MHSDPQFFSAHSAYSLKRGQLLDFLGEMVHHKAVDKRKAKCQLRSTGAHVPMQGNYFCCPRVRTLLLTSGYSCVMKGGTTLLCRMEWFIELQLLTLIFYHCGGPPWQIQFIFELCCFARHWRCNCRVSVSSHLPSLTGSIPT
jgi:hypothetical protein